MSKSLSVILKLPAITLIILLIEIMLAMKIVTQNFNIVQPLSSIDIREKTNL